MNSAFWNNYLNPSRIVFLYVSYKKYWKWKKVWIQIVDFKLCTNKFIKLKKWIYTVKSCTVQHMKMVQESKCKIWVFFAIVNDNNRWLKANILQRTSDNTQRLATQYHTRLFAVWDDSHTKFLELCVRVFIYLFSSILQNWIFVCSTIVLNRIFFCLGVKGYCKRTNIVSFKFFIVLLLFLKYLFLKLGFYQDSALYHIVEGLYVYVLNRNR